MLPGYYAGTFTSQARTGGGTWNAPPVEISNVEKHARPLLDDIRFYPNDVKRVDALSRLQKLTPIRLAAIVADSAGRIYEHDGNKQQHRIHAGTYKSGIKALNDACIDNCESVRRNRGHEVHIGELHEPPKDISVQTDSQNVQVQSRRVRAHQPEPQQTDTIGQEVDVYSRSHSSQPERLPEQAIRHQLDRTTERQPERPFSRVLDDAPDSFHSTKAAVVRSRHLPPPHQGRFQNAPLSELPPILPAFREGFGNLGEGFPFEQNSGCTYSWPSMTSLDLPTGSSQHRPTLVHPRAITKEGSSNTAATPNVDHSAPTTNCFTPVNPTTATDNMDAKSAVYQQSRSPYHRCPIPSCQVKPFIKRKALELHMVVHSSEESHYCPEEDCPRNKKGRGFKRKVELTHHAEVHKSWGYKCPICPSRERPVKFWSSHQKHFRNFHPGKQISYVISFLPSSQPALRAISKTISEGRSERLPEHAIRNQLDRTTERHMVVHSSEESHYCPEEDCPRNKKGRGFKRIAELTRHAEVHKSWGYKCPFCDSWKPPIKRWDSYEKHFKKLHPGKQISYVISLLP